ncbi:MAG: hypothetical protein JO210_01785 [Acidobacteriaceae bacterium]|nr:hypothetical protein [Acidobacteriaceae bacterium]
MPGRGPQTFKKRQKEQERKERQQEKMAKRLQRKAERGTDSGAEHDETMATDTESSPREPQGESNNL